MSSLATLLYIQSRMSEVCMRTCIGAVRSVSPCHKINLCALYYLCCGWYLESWSVGLATRCAPRWEGDIWKCAWTGLLLSHPHVDESEPLRRMSCVWIVGKLGLSEGRGTGIDASDGIIAACPSEAQLSPWTLTGDRMLEAMSREDMFRL